MSELNGLNAFITSSTGKDNGHDAAVQKFRHITYFNDSYIDFSFHGSVSYLWSVVNTDKIHIYLSVVYFWVSIFYMSLCFFGKLVTSSLLHFKDKCCLFASTTFFQRLLLLDAFKLSFEVSCPLHPPPEKAVGHTLCPSQGKNQSP